MTEWGGRTTSALTSPDMYKGMASWKDRKKERKQEHKEGGSTAVRTFTNLLQSVEGLLRDVVLAAGVLHGDEELVVPVDHLEALVLLNGLPPKVGYCSPDATLAGTATREIKNLVNNTS